MKDSRVEELKAQTQEAASVHCSKSIKSFKKSWKEKKKKWQKEKRDKKDFTPASGVNAIDTSGGKARKKKDLSQITCYNCDKKGYYSTKYPEPPKNGSKNYCQSWRPPRRWLWLVKKLWNVSPTSTTWCNFERIRAKLRLWSIWEVK